MSRLRFRDDVAASLVWMTAGGCWVAQLFVPWTSSGPFAVSSTVDGFRLVRSGAVDSIAPAWTAFALLLLPAVGLALLATASLAGVAGSALRLALGVLGALLVVAAVAVLVSFEISRVGPGGVLTLAGVALVAVGWRLDRSAG